MADWDADSPRLRRHLTRVVRDARDRAARREVPSLDHLRRWHRETMAGLRVPDVRWVGRFRGGPSLESLQAWVGAREGVPPSDVATELQAYERTLQRAAKALDALYPQGRELEADGLAAVVDLCAWAHAEWVRIHPFVNGNGCTARILANFLLMRYGIPPLVRLRPRPNGGYGYAADSAMTGDWRPTAAIFLRMLIHPR